MKSTLVLIICLIISKLGYSQSDVLLDRRDNQSYPVVSINGTLWMAENLNYETDLSYALDEELKSKYPNLKGRWYHMNELDTVCPSGWELPDAFDWIAYLRTITEENHKELKVRSGKENWYMKGLDEYANLFETDNRLNLQASGIFQGEAFVKSDMMDFWIKDLPQTEEEVNQMTAISKTMKPVKSVYPGKTHIHLYNPMIQFHSHDHHLDPNQKENLRRFLVRCVSYKQTDVF